MTKFSASGLWTHIGSTVLAALLVVGDAALTYLNSIALPTWAHTLVGIAAMALAFYKGRPAPLPALTPSQPEVTAKLPLGPVLLLLGLGLAAPAFAQESPKFGGCLTSHPGTCFAPSVSVNLVSVSLRDGSVTSTVDAGLGYGVSLFSDKWYTTGLSGTFTIPTYEGGRRLAPALTVSFAQYARLGIACPLWVAGGFAQNAQILIGIGSDFGSAAK